MIIIFDWKKLIVKKEGELRATVKADCVVRNEINSRRSLHTPSEVVNTMPRQGCPEAYMPRPFPAGIHEIYGVEWTDDPEYAPVKIRTNATRPVFIWELNEDGGYEKVTEEVQEDSYYLLHHSNSNTTLGCIRINKAADAAILARMVEAELDAGNPVFLEVI